MKTIKGLKVLETADFMRWCPSFYATAPKADVSDQYQFLNTRDMAVQLWRAGWMPTYAREARSVDPSNRGLTRHIVRWSNPDYCVNGERIELVGVNSHNRASAFTFMAGIYRLICSNGMIAQTGSFGEFKIKHIGADLSVQVEEAIAKIAGSASGLGSSMKTMKEIELTPNQQGIFAASAHAYIYEDPDSAPIKAEQLLQPRRGNDSHNGSYGTFGSNMPRRDLWTTFNVIQENAMKGGLRGRGKTGRRMKTRQIHSIDKDVKLNRALWIMAERMAEEVAA